MNSDYIYQASEPIELRSTGARDITFDGTHIWVVHNEGASKIDIDDKEELSATIERGELSSIVFDGKMLWTVQNRDREVDLRRCDLYTLDNCGGYELHPSEKGVLNIGRLCFDGTYIWATAIKNSDNISIGAIYRILP